MSMVSPSLSSHSSSAQQQAEGATQLAVMEDDSVNIKAIEDAGFAHQAPIVSQAQLHT